MENIYAIRDKKQHVYILTDSESGGNIISWDDKIAVIANLYYFDQLEDNIRFIEGLDECPIRVILISSNPDIIEYLESYKITKQKKNWVVVSKNNRGRDISALLVAGRTWIENSTYICFVHDKKSHSEQMEGDTVFWRKNLWMNMIGSRNYVQNVMGIFADYPEIGLLAPPEPIGKYISAWYCNVWGDDYKAMYALASELGINVPITDVYPPATIGTAFWCRTDAIKDVLKKQWNYEDFDEEPLADDGTISHAIERIWAYAAQNAGYEMGTVMHVDYARECYIVVQDMMRTTYKYLSRMGMGDFRLVELMAKRIDYIREICSSNKKIYLYGAGKIGHDCLHIMQNLGYTPEAFIETIKSDDYCHGIPIIGLKDMTDQSACILISVGAKKQKILEDNLKERNLLNYRKIPV